MTIAELAVAIEDARTYALPGKEAVAITDLMFELRELILPKECAQIIESPGRALPVHRCRFVTHRHL